jgi:hypothetical protein
MPSVSDRFDLWCQETSERLPSRYFFRLDVLLVSTVRDVIKQNH